VNEPRELDPDLDIAKCALASRQSSLRLTKLRRHRGVASGLDVRQAEELVNTAAAAIAETEGRIELTILACSLGPGTFRRDDARRLERSHPYNDVIGR